MTNFSLQPGHVRAEFFKPRGKWGYTEQLDMSKLYDTMPVHEAVALAAKGLHPEFTLVVLDPYHLRAHPIMILAQDRVQMELRAEALR